MTTTNERDLYYARRLAEMIRCKTVSRKEGFEPEEFLKLRRVIGTLFPLVTEKAERTILGEDAYLYKLPGKDPGRNVLLMSHHDVVEATGSWQEAPFAGVIRDGKLWGRGTVDTKTPLFAEFSALEELLLEGFEFPVNVYLFSSHNEEYSGDGALLGYDAIDKAWTRDLELRDVILELADDLDRRPERLQDCRNIDRDWAQKYVQGRAVRTV